jgi:hypothetical protein
VIGSKYLPKNHAKRNSQITEKNVSFKLFGVIVGEIIFRGCVNGNERQNLLLAGRQGSEGRASDQQDVPKTS